MWVYKRLIASQIKPVFSQFFKTNNMENLFDSLNHQDSAFFLLSLIISFLIGFIAAWAMWRGAAKRHEAEAAKWKKLYDDLTLELASVREKLDLSTADLAKAKREAEMAIEQASATQKEKMKWQKDLDQSLEETVRLNASNHSYQATIEDLNNQIIGLKTRAEEATDDSKLKEFKSAYETAKERLASLEAKVSQLTSENETLKAGIKKEDENLLNLLQSYNDSTNRLGSLEEKLSKLMAENSALKAELAEIDASAAADMPSRNAEPIMASINPADKESITGGAITPSDATNEVLAAIGNTIPTATADQKQDLTQIKGIGSFLEKKLNGLGIYTYEQISRLDPNLIEKLTTAIEFFPGRIERDDWVGQATLLSMPLKKKATPRAKSAKSEDLKVVEGIGPKIEQLLQEAGIKSLNDLATTTTEQLKEMLHQAGDHYRIHDPSTWPEQARLAAEGDLKKLKEYQDFLSAGKEPGK